MFFQQRREFGTLVLVYHCYSRFYSRAFRRRLNSPRGLSRRSVHSHHTDLLLDLRDHRDHQFLLFLFLELDFLRFLVLDVPRMPGWVAVLTS